LTFPNQSGTVVPVPGSLGRNYHRLWASSALSNLADGVTLVALPLLALRLTRSPAAVAGVSLAARLPWLLFALHAGALADRLDRRRVMVTANLGRAVVLGTLAALVALDAATLPALFAVAFVLGTLETGFDTSAQSIMPSIVRSEQLSRANGRLYAAEITTNQFLGPPLGGVLVAAAVATAFAGGAAVYALAGLLLLTLAGTYRPIRSGPATTLRADVAEGLGFLWRHRLLRTLAAMVGVSNLAFTAVFAVLPVFAVTPGPLGLSEAGFGLLLTSTAAGSVLGSLVAERAERRVGRARLLAGCVLGTGLPLVAVAVWPHAAVLAVGLAVAGASIVVWNVITVSLRQRVTPDRLLGRVNAAYRLLAWGSMPLGAGLGGLLAEVAGVRATFAGAGAVVCSLVLASVVVTDRAIVAAEAAPGVSRPEAQVP
jgi:MFS family permease